MRRKENRAVIGCATFWTSDGVLLRSARRHQEACGSMQPCQMESIKDAEDLLTLI
jgi:hypothetical protein